MAKSFSARVKGELSKRKFGKNEQLLAEIAAFAFSCGNIKLARRGVSLEFFCENEDVILREIAIIKRLYGVSPQLFATEKVQPKKHTSYSFEVFCDCPEGKLLFDIGLLTGNVQDYSFGEINRQIYLLDDCFAACLRGAFLGCGVLTDPNKKYLLEFVLANESFAEFLLENLNLNGFNAKMNSRAERSVIYIKKIESISAVLISIGATNAMMDIESIRVFKDVKNNINREDNCMISNMKKTITASQRQRDEIDFLVQNRVYLPPSLVEACELRLANPDSSLSQLAQISGISKSALNKRFIKIHEIFAESEGRNL